ncbi:EpsG family protein [Craterilacuibacter sp. RT1T]|nr:EpsG family protein [Craterilacuibacter sp. RT1T]
MNYHNAYQDQPIESISTRYEPLFHTLFQSFNLLLNNYYISSVLYFLTCIATLFLIIKSKKNIEHKLTFLLFMICLSGLDLFIDQIRQLMATIIIIQATYTKVYTDKKSWILYVLAASAFHASAIIAMLFLFIKDNKKTNIIFSTAISLIIAIGLLNIEQIAAELASQLDVFIFSKVIYYTSQFDVKLRFGVVMAIDLIIIATLVFTPSKKLTQPDRRITGLIFLASCLHITFYLFPILQRNMSYLYIPHALYAANHFKELTSGKTTTWSLFLLTGTIAISLISLTNTLTGELRPKITEWNIDSPFDLSNKNKLLILKEQRCNTTNRISPGFC